MKDPSPDQGPHRRDEVDPSDPRPSQPSWSNFQTRLQTSRQLLELSFEEEQLGQLEDDGEILRLERTVELLLKVLTYVLVALLTLAAIGLEVALLVISPSIFALSVPFVGGGASYLFKNLEGRGDRRSKPEDDP